MIEEVKKQVYDLLSQDESGHDFSHIERVFNMSKKFLKDEKADEVIVSLIALLHDVDDYKLFGLENAKNLTNARKIMDDVNIDSEVQEKVLDGIRNMGYNKALQGIRPNTLEGKIVSDADMCDAVGVNGIIRTLIYSIKCNREFFNKEIFPVENICAKQYTNNNATTGVCHLFEKALKLKDMMLTNSGKKEIERRHQITVSFLYQLFDEENVPEWKDYLDDFLKNN